ncbi:L,D-transpeptidase family protein [Temperatibacter marinus]|uniref:L,D-transpeptidase family protein n=1 Tax=Temperatibacter marinus TaxID=1456591 RepID=A0AA52EJ03_9PROT|nr:L,D-transpeptidase family protein [Temperatibacter marinus]WND03394.1 L,D-transpeptidase family protein [Temperatibacter marinus]
MTHWTVTQSIENPTTALMEGPLFKAKCSSGKKGFIPHLDGKEGDQMTPAGTYTVRQVFYRPDRISHPHTKVKIDPLSPDLGWCDDPHHKFYNKLVRLPFSSSHEKLWREDHVYDIIVVISHNDDPVVPFAGSAVFMHLARDDFSPTEGCIAMRLDSMLKFLSMVSVEDPLHFIAS